MTTSLRTQINNLKVSTSLDWVKVAKAQRAEILNELLNLSETDQKEVLVILDNIPVLEETKKVETKKVETKKVETKMEATTECVLSEDGICEGCST